MVATAQTVNFATSEQINQEIRKSTEFNLSYYRQHPDKIDHRLMELDQEWDTERTLETIAGSFMVFSALRGLIGGRKWFLLSGVVGGFLVQHAIQGWCPPLELIRRLGVRTPREIDAERTALKALRGDFKNAGEGQQSEEQLLQAAEC